jgi:hypothetical protein
MYAAAELPKEQKFFLQNPVSKMGVPVHLSSDSTANINMNSNRNSF